jgi:hypothetical protein
LNLSALRKNKKSSGTALETETEDGTEVPFYYTTAHEIRVAKTMCAFIAANMIILLSFTPNRLQAAGIGLVHGYIISMVWFVLAYSLLILAVTLRCLRQDMGKANGDYAAFSEDGYDRDWFDFVSEDIGQYPVRFSPSIGSGKGDRLSGRIVEAGMGLRHKYRGIAVAKIEASSGFYLCPLSGLAPQSFREAPGFGGDSRTDWRTGTVPLRCTDMNTTGIQR